jgi:adenosylmethionine-8-amino-7-oxononanoate aminotransferase
MPIALPYTHDGQEDYRIFSSGQGVYLYTADGKRILDGLSGSMNANLGHGNTVIAAAMQEQALRLTSLPSIAGDVSKDSIALADRLCGILQIPDSTCVFTSSGSEATEAALAVIWKYWSDAGQASRTKILSLDESYHGCTLGALAITGRAEEHTNIAPSLIPDYRLALPAWNTDDASRVSSALERVLTREDPETIAAIFLEPVMGLAGMIPAPRDDIRKVVELCRAEHILVVLDEALTGLGRPGQLTAADLYGIEYDLLLISKGLGCGFVPIASTCVAPHVASVLQKAPPMLRHGHTASANPLAARVASTVLDELKARDAVAGARQMGDVFMRQMRATLPELQQQYRLRGTGLCLAIETGTPEFAQRVRRIAFDLGLRIRAIDKNIIACPPLTISRHEIEQLATLLHRGLMTAEQNRTTR